MRNTSPYSVTSHPTNVTTGYNIEASSKIN
ncbi:hypothetical protein [Escherichia phage Ecp_YSF]|nr:hypothetical protein [Escherichia phage Ecp_YSF]